MCLCFYCGKFKNVECYKVIIGIEINKILGPLTAIQFVVSME